MTDDRLTKAIVFATEAHEGQTYHGVLDGNRYDVPYVFHALRVMMRSPPHLWVVAVLHDVLEDHGRLPWWLKARERRAIELLSRQDGESYEAYIDRIHGATGWAGVAALDVKLADLAENLSNQPSAEQEDRYLRAYWQLTGGRHWTDPDGRERRVRRE